MRAGATHPGGKPSANSITFGLLLQLPFLNKHCLKALAWKGGAGQAGLGGGSPAPWQVHVQHLLLSLYRMSAARRHQPAGCLLSCRTLFITRVNWQGPPGLTLFPDLFLPTRSQTGGPASQTPTKQSSFNSINYLYGFP
jgi:hypothetical protein